MRRGLRDSRFGEVSELVQKDLCDAKKQYVSEEWVLILCITVKNMRYYLEELWSGCTKSVSVQLGSTSSNKPSRLGLRVCGKMVHAGPATELASFWVGRSHRFMLQQIFKHLRSVLSIQ